MKTLRTKLSALETCLFSFQMYAALGFVVLGLAWFFWNDYTSHGADRLEPQTHQLWMIRNELQHRTDVEAQTIDLCKAHYDGMSEGLILGTVLPGDARAWLEDHPGPHKEWRAWLDKRLEQIHAAGELCPERVRETKGAP